MSNTQTRDENQLITEFYFPCVVYSIKKPEFLFAVKEVAMEHLEKIEKVADELYPLKMTDNFYNDERIKDFAAFVGSTAWNILEAQGCNTDNLNTTFQEMWCQEHHKHSAMDEHVHGYGAQIVGFYFLDTPKNCSKTVIHDPRAGKKQINLPERDVSKVSLGSTSVNFTPEPGLLLFTNSWLPHSFTRHGSDEPIRFVHFTLGVMQAQTSCVAPAAEVI